MDLDKIFEGMAAKPISGKGQYLPPRFCGIVELKALKWNPNGHNGKSAVFEYTLVTSNFTGELAEANPIGCTRSWVIKVDATNQYAGSDIKQIMMAIRGLDAGSVRSFEVDPEPHNQAMNDFKDAIKDPSLTEGVKVQLETQPYTTKGNVAQGKPSKEIALHKWSPAREDADTPALAAAA